MSRETSPTELAQWLHDRYEALAPRFGYETRKETREFDPDQPNGKLMIEVCREIIMLFTGRETSPTGCQCASCCVVRTAIQHGTLPAGPLD